jgi:uroporphyrinogen decarboxylase
MPNRERFLAICRGERPGDVSIIDWFNEPWTETPEVWVKQGAPEEIKNADAFNRYFQFDHLHALIEIIAGNYRSDLMGDGFSPFYVTPPVVPVFEVKVVREDERHRVETTYGGATVLVSKEFPWRMPKYLEYPVKDRATWNEYKKRLDPDTPERWPLHWNTYVEKTNSRDAPVMLLLSGFFGMLREWMGLENLLYAFHDDPGLVEEMMDQLLHLGMVVAKRATNDLRIDVVRFWEDMAYKSGPMISPQMFKKFMIPRYKKITDFLRGRGIDILYLESDGNVNELIPVWLDECGINLHNPLEVAAGMDGVALRKKYGKDLILCGNIDKRVFAKGKEAIRDEVMSKVPFLLETGGYFPCIDHAIPPDISFEDFRYFIDLLREIGGREKLP